jgi:hypothetical protein
MAGGVVARADVAVAKDAVKVGLEAPHAGEEPDEVARLHVLGGVDAEPARVGGRERHAHRRAHRVEGLVAAQREDGLGGVTRRDPCEDRRVERGAAQPLRGELAVVVADATVDACGSCESPSS